MVSRIRNERSSCPRVDTGNWARTGRDRLRPVRKSVVWTQPKIIFCSSISSISSQTAVIEENITVAVITEIKVITHVQHCIITVSSALCPVKIIYELIISGLRPGLMKSTVAYWSPRWFHFTEKLSFEMCNFGWMYSRTCLGRPLVWPTTRLGRPQSPAWIVSNNKVPGVSDHLPDANSDRVVWFNQRQFYLLWATGPCRAWKFQTILSLVKLKINTKRKLEAIANGDPHLNCPKQ